jgi:phosphatidylglycerophosphate synthase
VVRIANGHEPPAARWRDLTPLGSGDCDRTLFLVTTARLIFVPAMVAGITADERLLTAVALASFIVADGIDGLVARRRGADGPTRRALDSGVDRLAIWPVFIAASAAGWLPAVLVAGLILRDVYCFHWCRRIMRERRIAIGADWLYRGFLLLLASWLLAAPWLQASFRATCFAAVLAVGVIVAADLTRSARRILALSADVHDVVISAGELRRRPALGLSTSARHAGVPACADVQT